MSVTLPVIENPQKVSRRIALSVERSERLQHIAQIRLSSEDEVDERALDLYFQLTDFFEVADERQEWHRLFSDELFREKRAGLQEKFPDGTYPPVILCSSC